MTAHAALPDGAGEFRLAARRGRRRLTLALRCDLFIDPEYPDPGDVRARNARTYNPTLTPAYAENPGVP
jgi:hypothetical protein